MATEVPRIMQSALALMKYHVESEPEFSLYSLRFRCTGIGIFSLVYAFKCPKEVRNSHYEAIITVRWDYSNKLVEVRLSNNGLYKESDPELIMRFAGMFVKAGNLMRQLKAL